jgi:hypothetical protein
MAAALIPALIMASVNLFAPCLVRVNTKIAAVSVGN